MAEKLPTLDSIKSRTSLRALIVAELGEPDRRGWWLCPFHPENSPSFHLLPDGLRFYCQGCKTHGDVFDWVEWRRGVDKRQAIRILATGSPYAVDVEDVPGRPALALPGLASASGPPDSSEVRPAPFRLSDAWKTDAWQVAASRLIEWGEAVLWSDEGRPALEWLHARGLADRTIRAFRLGFFPGSTQSLPVESLGKHGDRVRTINVLRGVVFPWPAPIESGPQVEPIPPADRSEPGEDPDEVGSPTRWCGANVRCLHMDVRRKWDPERDGAKWRTFAGSERGHAYPHPELRPGVDALVAEGELDAILAFQELGHMVNVITAGGASSGPKPSALAALEACPRWLLALDADDAGDLAAEGWRRRGGDRCRSLLLPLPAEGNDIGDVVEAGTDLPSWLASEYRRLGLSPT